MNEWISVKDRLPEDAYEMIIADEAGITIGRYYKEQNQWYITYHGSHSRENTVTHWMPFPEGPDDSLE